MAAQNFKQWVRPIQRNWKTTIKPAAITGTITGAAIGGMLGIDSAYEHDAYGSVKYSNGRPVKKGSPFKRFLAGSAIGGAVGGLGFGAAAAHSNIKYERNLKS